MSPDDDLRPATPAASHQTRGTHANGQGMARVICDAMQAPVLVSV